MQRRSPTYELKFGLIGFAVGLTAVAGVAIAHNLHHHPRLASDSSPYAASARIIEARQ